MDRPQLELGYATPSAEAVAELAAAQFGLPRPIRCTLLSRGFNDCFELTAQDGRRYVLRISGRRLRGMADARSETEFLRHLTREGILVSAPVATIEGSFWTSATLPQGECPVVLFDYVGGRPPDHHSLADARAQGATLARIHNAAANFTQDTPCRYGLDLEHLLHRPLRAILALDSLSAATRTGLSELAQRLAEAVTARDDLESTYCHGDCHGYNAHIVTEGRCAGEAAFFDFDDGGPGYLAYDLAVFLWARVSFGRREHAKWRAFVAGYRALRPGSEAALEAAHLFVPIRHIWLMGEYAARSMEWGSRSAPADWISSQFEFMQDWEARTIKRSLL
jgi:Ser/Thr protein kinase RdoA (MazF antagonist)